MLSTTSLTYTKSVFNNGHKLSQKYYYYYYYYYYVTCFGLETIR